MVPTGGTVRVGGHDIRTDWRAARKLIGLVPQEIALEPFEKVLDTVRFTRGLYGEPPDDAWLEQVLRSLALWDKRDARTRELSGGMKRRVLIAKALSHRPKVLFLDEPTAGVDVALRRDMWKLVHSLRERGTTIILTTHYIEEAEEMADRVGVINKGRLLLVDDKAALMHKLGKRELDLTLVDTLDQVPAGLDQWQLSLVNEGRTLRYVFDATREDTGIPSLLRELSARHVAFKDLETSKSSLEDIFVDLVEERA